MRIRCTSAVVAALVLVLALPAAACAGVAPRGAKATTTGISSATCARNRAAGVMTFVSPFSFDASAGIIDVFAADSLGYFKAQCISVRFVTNSETATALVSSGAGTISGEGSAADDLQQVAAGLHLTAIATYGNTSDYALLTSKNITSLKQLDGKVVAYHVLLPAILHEMLLRAGVKYSSLHLVNDTTYNPTLVTSGVYQGLQAYQTNEPLTLREAHLTFHEFIPATYKISGTFNVEVVNTTFLRDHPSAVAGFLRAELHAFAYCAAHEARCVDLEAARARSAGLTPNVTHMLAEWQLEVRLAEDHHLAGEGIGVQSIAEWQPEVHLLTSLHVLSTVPALSGVEDTSLAASLYRGSTLVWPGS